MNRLARETSPYLRQHAENPVDWHAWGKEALTRAREEDRPILLSIGYSSCHWCHVMERESFSDPETARILNELYIPVKVDREERPDLDGIYMRAVQAMTGRGGWPLTAFLTPEGVPFYGGTYFPPEPRHGMPSFRQVMEAVAEAWRERREEIQGSAGRIREVLARGIEGSGGEGVDRHLLEEAVRNLLAGYDEVNGGFGSAPKFPQPVVLQFLLEMGDEEAADAARHTLLQMARGGIRDHLAGGFHRYSVDARWLVPHFEKMLYDNALLARAFLEAWKRESEVRGTLEREVRGTLEREIRGTLDWILAEMQAPEGGFYSALDADSEGEEGRFYVWDAQEVDEILGQDGPLLRDAYGVRPEGNWEGTNILHLPRSLEAWAETRAEEGEEDAEALLERVADARRRLLQRRERRERPFRDFKILASWNGMAIRALAEAGVALPEPRYVEAAEKALDRLLAELPDEEGRLRHQLTEGVAAIPAFLDDVAALGNAALSLHEATLDPRWLARAEALGREIEERFLDPETGLLMDTPADGEELILRPREVMDNAVPSGTSLAAEVLFRLGRLLGREGELRRAREMVDRESEGLRRAPAAFGRLLSVALRVETPPVEVAILGPPEDPRTGELLQTTHRLAPPGAAISGGVPAEVTRVLSFPHPLLEGRGPVEGAPAAWVCRSHACRAPVTTPEALSGELLGRSPSSGLS